MDACTKGCGRMAGNTDLAPTLTLMVAPARASGLMESVPSGLLSRPEQTLPVLAPSRSPITSTRKMPLLTDLSLLPHNRP
jgi:hypothetical protein